MTAVAPAEIEIDAKALPLYCPPPGQPLWNAHPRVYLPLDAQGKAHCPYCGARYRLSPGHAAGAAASH